ncbi:CAAX amino terminal protease self- immunity [Corynebacterium kalinowskii]|uniref:CAAX amino terminal protease self- immunity n=1 Tax=Corynebacterium kalinowskii TaxID=2675216 RepID=A0A6B8W5C4_9CORY|nr:CPBP family intramembrane glutamic endopeptidase [Corynebacterium kalinowskii]QGU02538.1 CAAX amino terminal protease self- immunity [Corynebacterium kalinowskii]
MTTPSLPKPLVPPTWWGLALRSIVAVGILFGANIAAGAIVYKVVPSDNLSHYQQLWAVSAIFIIVFLLVWAAVATWIKLVERRPFSITGMRFHRKWASGLAVGTLLSAAIVVATRALSTSLFPNAPREVIDGSQLGEATWLTFTVFILGRAFFLQGIPEELLFRGWLFQLLPQRPKVTLAFTTAVFTVIHLISNGGQQSTLDRFLYLMLPLGFGLLAGTLVMQTGNFWQAAGIHGGFHVGTVLSAFVMPSSMVAIDWVVIGTGYLVVAVGLLKFGKRRRQANVISS